MRFRLKAVNPRQEVVALDLSAANESDALDAARERGLAVLAIRPLGLRPFGLRVAPGFPVTLFSIELLALLEAGLNLVEALQTLSEKELHGERRVVLAGILAAIHRGEPFSRALGRFPQFFPAIFMATVRASERTGNVREALARYIAYQEELDRVRRKLVAAAIYPAILVVVAALVLGFLMFYVVPRFARVYEDISGTLPFFSAALLAVGRGVEQHGWMIALAGAGVLALGAWGVSLPAFRAWLHEQLWRLPDAGERMKVYQLARLYRTAGMLLRAGIPVLRALDMARDVLAAHLRPHLARARELISQGRTMSAAFGAAGLATPVAARMMAVGERGGEMGEMLDRIARFHDEETARYVDWLTRAAEPVLMALLGAAVGLVVLLMYMPVFELAGSLR
jgi:general secretion pathway protein F